MTDDKYDVFFKACSEIDKKAEVKGLRDHFASQALAGLTAIPYSEWVAASRYAGEDIHEFIAETAYEIADAMLAAREVKP